MKEYHKIHTIFKRNTENNSKTLIMDQFSLPEFEYLQHNQWSWSEKVDGTNIRVVMQDQKVTYAGKTDAASIPATLVQRLRDIFDPQIDTLNALFPEGGCLYGEGYGPKIQKVGGLYGSVQDFVLFDIQVGPWWLQRTSIEETAEKLGLRTVPIIGHGTLWDMVELVRPGMKSTWGDFPAEGIVARPAVELRARNNQRIITKLKTRDFVH